MELKWYFPAKLLGLVEDISYQYNDGFIHHSVSARTGDVFLTFFLALIPILFLTGFLLRRRFPEGGQKAVRVGSAFLLLYALTSAIGLGPYIQFYPQSAEFLDLSLLEHIVQGLYCALLALSLFLGGKLAARLSRRQTS